MIINFTLDKISIEKLKEPTGNIEAKNSIKFLDIQEIPTPKGIKDQSILKFKFTYKIEYSPNIANTEIIGYIHYLTSKEERDKIMKEWDKDSKIDRNISTKFVNYIFSKCGIKSLSLSQELNLPSHIPLPRIALKKTEETKTKPKAS